MTAIKINPKMFSGGALKTLPDVLRGLAIDNARNAFKAMGEPMSVNSKLYGMTPLALMAIPIPSRVTLSQEIPASFWDMAAVAVHGLATLAGRVNSVGRVFGLKPLVGGIKSDQPIQPVTMELVEGSGGIAGEGYAIQMSRLRDSLTAIAIRVSEIRVAMGMPALPGSTDGSLKCTEIYPVMQTHEEGSGTSFEALGDFLVAYNYNLHFIVSEWNDLFGVSEPGFELTTALFYDDTILELPPIVREELQTSHIPMNGEVYDNQLSDILVLLKCVENQVVGLSDTFQTDYESCLGDIPEVSGRMLSVEEFDIGDEHALEHVIVEMGAAGIWRQVKQIKQAMQSMLVTLNYALILRGETPIMDAPGIDTPDGFDNYCVPVLALEATIKQLLLNVCTLANGVARATAVEDTFEELGLHVIAG